MIDLRSDTVTQPTEGMRRAMAEAVVGDDVFGDDPTVNELQRATAELLGKEAALFVPSGTMANQLGVRSHVQPGDEILVEADAHIFNSEAGAAAALSGATCRTIAGRRGVFTAADMLARIQAPDVHHAPARLVCVENTHNVGGGVVWMLESLRDVANAAHAHGLAVHMDGARLWNATAASGIPEREYASVCDTVSVCYSKGLGAPVGSALAGSAEAIERARRFRKMMGGGMRQAGVLAAAALYALKHHRPRIAEDHANAKILAEGLAGIAGVELDRPPPPRTNIVRFRTPGIDATAIMRELRSRGVALLTMGPDSFRAVTHLMLKSDDIHAALAIMEDVLRSR